MDHTNTSWRPEISRVSTIITENMRERLRKLARRNKSSLSPENPGTMTSRTLSGVEWRALSSLFKLQEKGVVPKYPWDIMRTGTERLRGHDIALGGDWDIMEQAFVFEWDVLPNNFPSSPNRKPTILRLCMRGELPLELNGKPMQSKEAQRNWFVDVLRLEAPTKQDDADSEIEVLELASRDDVMNLLDPPTPETETPKS